MAKTQSLAVVRPLHKSYGFNKAKDLHVVEGRMSGVDLRTAYVKGAVPAAIPGTVAEYNDVEDPSTIMTRPADAFEAMRQSDYVKGSLRARAEAESEAPTEGE